MKSKLRRQMVTSAMTGIASALLGSVCTRVFAANAVADRDVSRVVTAIDQAAPASAMTEATGDVAAHCPPLLAHALRPLVGGETTPLCQQFSNDVLLIVNTASRCGFTPQFEALEELHQRYSARGLSVLGFPSDDFRQELADEAEVAEFCRLNYGVSFPMFQKVSVRGDTAHPLFTDLAKGGNGFPAWNFNKYLVDRNGAVVARFEAHEQPLGERLTHMIETLL